MATQTQNLKLTKPLMTQAGDVEIINSNMDIIDAQVAKRLQPSDVINVLNSSDATKPLSANQGKTLNDRLVNFVNTDLTSKRLTTPDLDQIVTPGMYGIQQATNSPSANKSGYLIVMKYNADNIKQVFYPLHLNEVWTRVMKQKVWQDWIDEPNIGITYSIPVNTDMNTLLTPGFYNSTGTATTSTLSNCPVSTNAFSLIVKVGIASTYRQQYLSAAVNNVLYYRRTSNADNNWTDWRQIITYDQFGKFVTSNGNSPEYKGQLADLITPGMYYCTSIPDPPGSSQYGYVIVMRQNQYSIKQIYFGYHNNYIFVRYSTSGEWTPWVTVYNSPSAGLSGENEYCTMTAKYTISNGICVCDFVMTPKTNITSSTGAVTFSNLPVPIQGTKGLVYNADSPHCCKINQSNAVAFEGGAYTNGTKYYATLYYRISQ